MNAVYTVGILNPHTYPEVMGSNPGIDKKFSRKKLFSQTLLSS